MSTNTKLAEALRYAAKQVPELATVPGIAEALAAHDAERAAKAVPAGFVPVPVEPDLGMLQSALNASRANVACGMTRILTDGCELWAAGEVYRAMLAAAPTPPAPEAQQAAGQELPPLQAGMTNTELAAAWKQKLPGVEPTYNELSAFALGAEVGFARAALAQRREPLTASQVHELCDECHLDWHCGWAIDEEPNRYLELARAIEKHYGIGSTTGEQR